MACAGAWLSVNHAHARLREISERAQAQRVAGPNQQAQLPAKTLDHGDICSNRLVNEREIVLASVGIKQMRQRKIRHAIAERCEPGAASHSCHEERGWRLARHIKIPQNTEARVIAARSEKIISLPFAIFLDDPPAVLLDPFIDQLLGKHPFSSDSGTRKLATLGQVVDLLLIDPQVLRDLFRV